MRYVRYWHRLNVSLRFDTIRQIGIMDLKHNVEENSINKWVWEIAAKSSRVVNKSGINELLYKKILVRISINELLYKKLGTNLYKWFSLSRRMNPSENTWHESLEINRYIKTLARIFINEPLYKKFDVNLYKWASLKQKAWSITVRKKKTEFGCKDENYASSTHESELKESNTKYKISLYLIPF